MIPRIWSFFVALTFFFQPVFALAADEAESKPEWVLSYFLILLFVGLGVLVLLRPANRSETAFTQEEIDQRKEEEMKKMKRH